MNQSDYQPEPASFLMVYGRDVRLVTDAGVDYIDPRPLCEMAHINWPVFEGTLLNGDAVMLFGSKRLCFPTRWVDGSDKPSTFIRRDRLKLFLLRIDTEKMRWRGMVKEADQLLEDQEKWADELSLIDHRW